MQNLTCLQERWKFKSYMLFWSMLVLAEENRKQDWSPWQLPECLSLSWYCWAQWSGLQGLGSALSFFLSYLQKKNPQSLAIFLFQAASEVPLDNLEIALSRQAEYQPAKEVEQAWGLVRPGNKQEMLILVFDRARAKGWGTPETWQESCGRKAGERQGWHQRREAELIQWTSYQETEKPAIRLR